MLTAIVPQDPSHEQIEIKVTDQGCGLQDLTPIGELFTKLEISNNVNQNGIGFGLSISKVLMEQMQGSIEIQNNNQIMDIKSFY